MRFEDERQESEEQRVGDEIIRKRFVAGMASFLIHLLGVIIGRSFIFIYKNKIKKNIELINY